MSGRVGPSCCQSSRWSLWHRPTGIVQPGEDGGDRRYPSLHRLRSDGRRRRVHESMPCVRCGWSRRCGGRRRCRRTAPSGVHRRRNLRSSSRTSASASPVSESRPHGRSLERRFTLVTAPTMPFRSASPFRAARPLLALPSSCFTDRNGHSKPASRIRSRSTLSFAATGERSARFASTCRRPQAISGASSPIATIPR